MLDQTLASFAGGGVYIGKLFVDTCQEAVRILSKQNLRERQAKSSDPAFNMAAQLLAARLNGLHGGAGQCPNAVTAMVAGQVAVGVCANLRQADRITSTHRGHGHVLAKRCRCAGDDAGTAWARRRVLRRQGRVHAHRGFRGGHAGRRWRGRRGHPDRLRRGASDPAEGEDAMVACFFGDGAINRGPFLEGLNWAALYRLPLLFVCEDNGFAAFTVPR